MQQTDEFVGKSIIVTGAARGIGFQIARLFALAGARVCLADMDAGPLEEALLRVQGEGEGGDVLGVVADVSRVDQVQTMVARAHARFGRVDVLVNNAGGSAYTPPEFDRVTEADFDRVMGWNVKSAFFCAQAVLPHFREQGGGLIVNMSAISGRAGTELLPAQYSAAKAAVIGLTRNLARQLGPENVRVNAVAPGFIRSGPRVEAIWNARDPRGVLAMIPLRRRGETSEVARAVMYLASDAASYTTGAILDVNGGFLCV